MGSPEPARIFVQEIGGKVSVSWIPAGEIAPEPAGEAVPWETPLSPEELESLRWYLEDYLRAPYAVYEERGQGIERQLSSWGERLFAPLFGSEAPGRDLYVRGRTTGECELWISSNSAAFLSIPWELMRDPERKRSLALDLAGVNRTLKAAAETVALPSGEGLRVLMVIARPGGAKDIRYRMVARPLLERLDAVAGGVHLEVLRPPTFETLRRRLEKAKQDGEPFQVVHFDGHGVFGQGVAEGTVDPLRYRTDGREGFLSFETETGDGEPVAGKDLAPVLVENEVPLVVLNACQSAMVGGSGAPEAAVATRLLADGVASVVAMSYSVYAVAAAEFMATFYEALFAGKDVSRAVTDGRRQLARQGQRPSPKGPLPLEDWMVPAHYAKRRIAFPELVQKNRSGTLTLEEALGEKRQAEHGVKGVHEEGDVTAEAGLFFGRDAELLELERALRLEHVVLLHGVGGTGKTELAKGFARWLRDSGGLDDPGLIFFHSFEPGIATFGLDGVVASVGLRFFGPQFAQLEGPQRIEAVLEALRRHRMLLVWDNFETVYSMPDPTGATAALDDEERGRVQSFLQEVQRSALGGVVITSRAQEGWLGRPHRLSVEGLRQEDVQEYADALLAPYPQARPRREERAFAELLAALQGHPLSLRLILPRLAEVENVDTVLRELRGERGIEGRGEESGGRLVSLDACVHYSFAHLPPEHQDLLPALICLLQPKLTGDSRVIRPPVPVESDGRFRGI